MVDPHDPFGQTMLENLSERGCDLLGIEACPNLASQVTRLNNHWQKEGMNTFARAETMTKVYQNCLDANEKSRVEKIEWFDEFEEWVLLQNHYCIAFASRSAEEGDPVSII